MSPKLLVEKKKLNVQTPRLHMSHKQNFSPFGPAVLPAIGNMYMIVLYYYMNLLRISVLRTHLILALKKMDLDPNPCYFFKIYWILLSNCYVKMLLLNGKSDDASRVMVELLGTYTTENASQAREEAQRCIIASLAGNT